MVGREEVPSPSSVGTDGGALGSTGGADYVAVVEQSEPRYQSRGASRQWRGRSSSVSRSVRREEVPSPSSIGADGDALGRTEASSTAVGPAGLKKK